MSPEHRSRPALATPRLRLSPANPGDAQALQSIWNELDVRRFLWDNEEVSLARAREAVEAGNDAFRQKGFGLWCVSLIHSGVLAGFCGLREFGDAGNVEILFGLAPARAGHGYATEAVRAVLAHGFGACGLSTIWGQVDEPNARSIRLLEKLGMTKRGARQGPHGSLFEYALDRGEFSAACGTRPP